MRIVAICLVFVATVFIGDRVVSSGAKQVVEHSRNPFARLFFSTNKADILLLGDSRVDRNISLESIRGLTGKAPMNLGLGGNNPLISEALLRDYLRLHGKPELVIVELGHSTVDPRALGEMRIFSFCSTNIARLARTAQPVYSAFSNVFASLQFNDPAFVRVAADVFGDPTPRLLHNRIPLEIVNRWKSARPMQRTIYAENMQALKRLVELSNQEHFRLEFILSPCWGDFRKAIANYDEWKNAMQQAVGSRQIHDYTDAFNDFPELFNDELHLNAGGAERFVQQLLADKVL